MDRLCGVLLLLVLFALGVPQPSVAASTPEVAIYDVQVGPNQTQVYVPVRVAQRTGYTFTLRYRVTGAKGVAGPSHSRQGQGGEFILAHDVDEWLIPVELARPLQPGEAVKVELTDPRAYGAWTVALKKPVATISRKAAAKRPTGGVAVQAGSLPQRRRPPAYRETFRSDLLKDFQASDSGYDAAGRPIWKTQLGHGRTQDNGELGIATDPMLHAGVRPFQIIDGRRALVAEVLPSPIRYKGKDWRYSSPVLTTETFFRMGYGWSEARLSLDPKPGLWPAFWAKPSPHWIWPPELDHLEVAFKGARPAEVSPFFTQWWRRGGKPAMRGVNVNVHALFPDWRWQDFHTYAVHWTPEVTEWIIDGVLVHSQPTEIKLGAQDGAEQDGKLYLKLNVAVGGQAGAPTPASFPARMRIEHVAVWEP